jgi:hypothetical protein
MSKDVLIPRQVPSKMSEEWFSDADHWANPLAPAIRHAELKQQSKKVWQSTLVLAAVAIGLAAGMVLHMLGLVLTGWIAVAIGACLSVLAAVLAFRLTLQAHLAYQEASVVQKAACGAIRVVRSPDDPRPAKLDSAGNIIEEPEVAQTGT